MKKKSAIKKTITIKNKRASYEYELLQKYTAGLVLQGTEVKSIRLGKVSMLESFCYFDNGELYVKQMHIALYSYGNINNHIEDRPRKLLLNKHELAKLIKAKEKGMTIIPTKMFINQRGFAKLEISLARGKKLHDKRQSIKEKDLTRELERSHRDKY